MKVRGHEHAGPGARGRGCGDQDRLRDPDLLLAPLRLRGRAGPLAGPGGGAARAGDLMYSTLLYPATSQLPDFQTVYMMTRSLNKLFRNIG